MWLLSPRSHVACVSNQQKTKSLSSVTGYAAAVSSQWFPVTWHMSHGSFAPLTCCEPRLVLFLSLCTAGRVQSLPHWFRLLTRWRKKAIILLTKSPCSKAASSKPNSTGKKSSRAGYRSWRDAIRFQRSRQNPGQASGDRLRTAECILPHQDAASRKIPAHKHRETGCRPR